MLRFDERDGLSHTLYSVQVMAIEGYAGAFLGRANEELQQKRTGGGLAVAIHGTTNERS